MSHKIDGVSNRFANIPAFLIMPLRIVKAFYKLPSHIEVLYTTRSKLAAQVEHTHQQLADQTTLNHELLHRSEELTAHLNAVDTRLTSLSSRQSTIEQPQLSTPGTKQRFADNHDLDEFYVGFEDNFRGDEAAIKEKVRIYPPIVKASGLDFKKYPAIDIGCGRGELLEAFAEQNIRAIGLDINFTMVERARSSGYEAQQGDAVQYIQSLSANSVGAITGMHIVEHIPFDELVVLFKECYRVLAPGGLVIFETPNPENLMVGIYSFYMDPSHLSPLPPPLLGFALESVGFSKVEIKRLHDAGGQDKVYDDPLLQDLSYRMYGPLDYAAIGTKPGGANKPRPRAKR